MHRRGSLLIIVSGLCTLLAILAVTFLSRARTDIDEADNLARQAQARIMLSAACCYLLEAAPAAHHDPVQPGDQFFPGFGTLSGTPRLIGRFPMHSLILPPRAIPHGCVFQQFNGFRPFRSRQDPTTYQTVANPFFNPALPVGNSNWDYAEATNETTIRSASPTYSDASKPNAVNIPSQSSINTAWFRIYYKGEYSSGTVNYDGRAPPGTLAARATFMATCGAGASLGYRDWAEVPAADRTYFGDAATFNAIAASESRMWFEVSWSTINVYHDANKPSLSQFPPMFSDASDPATYSPNLWILPPGGPSGALPASGDPDQYVIPWDPVRISATKTNDFTKGPPFAAKDGHNKYPVSLDSDAFRIHGRIVKIIRHENQPAGDQW
jgi:hypothetical protein